MTGFWYQGAANAGGLTTFQGIWEENLSFKEPYVNRPVQNIDNVL